jgi:hypothetical protein
VFCVAFPSPYCWPWYCILCAQRDRLTSCRTVLTRGMARNKLMQPTKYWGGSVFDSQLEEDPFQGATPLRSKELSHLPARQVCSATETCQQAVWWNIRSKLSSTLHPDAVPPESSGAPELASGPNRPKCVRPRLFDVVITADCADHECGTNGIYLVAYCA